MGPGLDFPGALTDFVLHPCHAWFLVLPEKFLVVDFSGWPLEFDFFKME